MPDETIDIQQLNRRNDQVLLRPLLIMGLIITGGLLFYAYSGDQPSSVAQAPVTQTQTK